MSLAVRYLALLLLLLPASATAQVLRSAKALEKGTYHAHLAGVVLGGEDSNVLMGIIMARGAITDQLGVTLRAGVTEDDALVGAQFDLQMRNQAPYVGISAGAHHQNDLSFDGTVNATWPLRSGIQIYSGVDFDLIMDDDPDLPAWAFLGALFPIRPTIDIHLEAAAGIVPIASEIFTAGFVFSF